MAKRAATPKPAAPCLSAAELAAFTTHVAIILRWTGRYVFCCGPGRPTLTVDITPGPRSAIGGPDYDQVVINGEPKGDRLTGVQAFAQQVIG